MPSQSCLRTAIDINGHQTPLTARVNRRAKRLILKVDPIAGEILVTSPSKRALPEAIAFARERAPWIASQLAAGAGPRPFEIGAVAPLRGVLHDIRQDEVSRRPVRRCDEHGPAILVSGEPAHANRRIVDWMKREARRDLEAAVDLFCARLDRARRPIRVRDTRTRWGSCTSDGTMSFSWRLIMAPPEILTYVAAHECAHLAHMNHSPAFWRVVRALGVDAARGESWLDEHGPGLFAYGQKPRNVASSAA
ncbi:MAG: SprT family zinc-dependent metalloprotease [Pseudomonadota bacterium]